MLSLALRIDAVNGTTHTEFTLSDIGVNAGRFAPQRLLDIYNEARLCLFNALRQVYPSSDLSRYIGRTVVTKTDLTFASGVATVPAGFLKVLSLRDAAGTQIFVVKPTLGPTIANANANGTSKHFKETATNRFVMYENGTLRSESGSTFIPNAATYQLKYYGVPLWTLTDVTNGTTVEVFDDDLKPKLMEIAEKISMEQGLNEVNALALSLVGKNGTTTGN